MKCTKSVFQNHLNQVDGIKENYISGISGSEIGYC